MAIPLHSLTTCAVSEENTFENKLLKLNALLVVPDSNPIVFKPICHTKEQGLVNYDFKFTDLKFLLDQKPMGLRVFPVLSTANELTVLITGYDANGDEIFQEGGLVAVCCPQPPPPFNRTSALYHQLFPQQDA